MCVLHTISMLVPAILLLVAHYRLEYAQAKAGANSNNTVSTDLYGEGVVILISAFPSCEPDPLARCSSAKHVLDDSI